MSFIKTDIPMSPRIRVILRVVIVLCLVGFLLWAVGAPVQIEILNDAGPHP